MVRWMTFAFFSMVLHSLMGQSIEKAKDCLAQINEYYAQNPNIEMEVEYRLFKNHNTEDVFEQKQAMIRQSGVKAYYKLEDTEAITDGKYDLLVNNSDKSIIIANHTANFIKDYRLEIDSLLRFCQNAQIDDFGTVSCIYLTLPLEEVKGVAICFDEKNFSLKKLVLYYRNPQDFEENTDFKESMNGQDNQPRLEIHYLKNEVKSFSNTEEFKIATYVHKTSTTFEASLKYSQYKIFDQTFE
jgi:hypothetical protein